MVNVLKKQIEEIQGLKLYISKEWNKKLEQILIYWEEMESEWERKKKEFWSKCDRYDYKRLLGYMFKNWEDPELKYEYLDKMNSLEKGKFVEEYLLDDILYSGIVTGKLEDYKDFVWWTVSINNWWLYCKGKYLGSDWMEAIKMKKLELTECMELDFNDNEIWDEWVELIANNLELKRGVKLDLSNNNIWVKWVNAISKMEMKWGVELNLDNDKIWDEWVIAIAKNMKLEEWDFLHLQQNEIWDEWAKAISGMQLKYWVNIDLGRNNIWDEWVKAIASMELKEWVKFDLVGNKIWDKWAEAIMKNMKLKNGMELVLVANDGISKEMRDKLKAWEKSYIDSWITCSVLVSTW